MSHKAGIFGQPLTRGERLKAATYQAHAGLQALPFFEALFSFRLPVESYAGYLRAMAVVAGTLGRATSSCDHPSVRALWSPDMLSLDALLRDIAHFAPMAPGDIPEAVDQSQNVAAFIRIQAVEMPAALVGLLYVIEGSSLGAGLLAPKVRRAFLLKNDQGVEYLSSSARGAAGRWQKFLCTLDGLDMSEREDEAMVSSATEMFRLLAGVFHALYPFDPQTLRILASTINPEAGRHPVASDPHELEASRVAAERCWNAFPYMEERYGERGRRFAASDGAWLATLHTFDAGVVRRQIEWLGRVLATRGMPTSILEEKLRMLAGEFHRTVPGNPGASDCYLAAADHLRVNINSRIDADTAAALVREFNSSAGDALCAQFQNVGDLLVAAVADELNGCDGAVENIAGWMTAPARFPEPWIAAVRSLVEKTREQAKGET